MVFQESETVELKEVVVDDIRKEIIAFANCDGGKLYIGVRDDGTVVGWIILIVRHCRLVIWLGMRLSRILRCSCIMGQLRRVGKRLLQLTFREEQIALLYS